MRAWSARAVLCLTVVGALVSLADQGHAYCRTTTCDVQTQDCGETNSCATKGLPLYWPVACTSYDLHAATPANITPQQFSDIAWASFSAWTSVSCDGQAPSIKVVDLGPIQCVRTEYRQDAGNVNAVFFQTQKWPYAMSASTLALTTVTFNTQTGEIYDVDMEINDVDGHITAGDSQIEYDLQSIITHEAGHFYGLAHSPNKDSTMYEKYAGAGSTTLRTLEQDDVDGMCTIYAPGRSVGACDPTPRHGYASPCSDGSDDGKCSMSASSPPLTWATASSLSGLGLIGLAALVRRRRSKRQSRG